MGKTDNRTGITARPVLIRRLDLYAGNGPWILECFEDPEGEKPCGPEDDFVRADVWYPAEHVFRVPDVARGEP